MDRDTTTRTNMIATKIVLLLMLTFFGVLWFYGITQSTQSKLIEENKGSNEVVNKIPIKSPESARESQHANIPPAIDIQNRIYTPKEVAEKFGENEFRVTNSFKKCMVMIEGKVTKIGTVAFSSKPEIQIDVPNMMETLFFEFEDTEHDNDAVAAINVGDIVILAGKSARKGVLGGVFLSKTQFMSPFKLRGSSVMLVLNNGIYDKMICKK